MGLKWCRLSHVVGIPKGSSTEITEISRVISSYYQASQNVDQHYMKRLFSRIKIILGHRKPQTSKFLVICTSYFSFFLLMQKITKLSESFIMKEPQKVMILEHSTFTKMIKNKGER